MRVMRKADAGRGAALVEADSFQPGPGRENCSFVCAPRV